jgi:hypothetical protein
MGVLRLERMYYLRWKHIDPLPQRGVGLQGAENSVDDVELVRILINVASVTLHDFVLVVRVPLVDGCLDFERGIGAVRYRAWEDFRVSGILE